MASKEVIPQEIIEKKIFVIRGQKTMLDQDLAILYEVPTKVLLQAVKRNSSRFPDDFMFQFTRQEFLNLRSQIVTSSWGGRRYLPFAFTEFGIAMLSSVLNSERAIQTNIQIMRVFTKLRTMVLGYGSLKRKLGELEEKYDKQFKVVFTAIRQLISPPEKPKKRIGF